MRLYQKLIRPMHCYPGQYYEPKTEPIEKEEKWYPEEERDFLEKKYGYLNEGHFSDLVFDKKYEPCDDLTLLKEQEAAQQKPGEWIYVENESGQDGYECSECGFFEPWYYDYENQNFITNYAYCPSCGKPMREGR